MVTFFSHPKSQVLWRPVAEKSSNLMISCLENLRGGSGNVSGPQTVHSLGGVGGPWEAGITLGSRALLGVGGTCWRSLKVNPFLSQNNIAVLVLLWSNLTSRDICARR